MRRSSESSKRPTKLETPIRPFPSPKRPWMQVLLVVAGIIVGQSAIYGPCLIGQKILLPLDGLARGGVYIPRTPEIAEIQEWDRTLSDMVRVFEPARRFAVREYHAGRLPMWTPDYFAGAPFIWPKFSPFSLLVCLTESPVILAWKELATALVAGLGMYYFSRRALATGFWPACVAAWCYPLTGFFIIWQGFFLRQTVCVLPWLLWAVDSAVRRRGRFGIIGLSLATSLTLVAGQLDAAGQVLLVSGFYALWCIWDEFGRKSFSAPARRAMLGLAVGWTLGFMLAAPQVAPTIEYTRTGMRTSKRAGGEEERPPAGRAAIPHIVVPDYYGRATRNSVLILPYQPGNLQESAVGAYAGVLAMLFAAPLAFWSQRHRSRCLLLLGIALFGVSWILDFPLFVRVLRLPGLNMMSHNRLTFATSFALLALGAIGLELLAKGGFRWRRWHWLLAFPLAAVSALCIYRAIHLPELVAGLDQVIARGETVKWIENMNDVRQVQHWYKYHLLAAGGICALGTFFWFALSLSKTMVPRLLFPIVSLSLIADLVWFAQKWQPQCDPALYYPKIPALDQTAHAKSGRVVGYGYLPPNLASMAGLRDIRGYDAVDPSILIELLAATTVKTNSPSYAQTQNLVPRTTFFANATVQFPRILDLLGVRYLILRGEPTMAVRFKSFDYYVLENTNALPRAFVPRRVESIPEHEERLLKLRSPDFDPRQVAFVETTIELPGDCRGNVEIRDEIPTRVTLEARMETAGLIVLSDLWDQGWRAYRDGKRVSILRTNHALRGVVAAAGSHVLEFRYEPASFTWGVRLAALAVLTLIALFGFACRGKKEKASPLEPVQKLAAGNQREKPVRSKR